jgi:hypothetical protein
MTFSVVAVVCFAAIPNSNLSIRDSVLSKLAASAAATASAEMSAPTVASALAIGVILDAEADGGVRSMASIIVLILHFFCPFTFL